MNRIVIGSSNNEVGVLKEDKLIVDVKKDTNFLIENNEVYNYVFNVDDANLNILNIRESKNNISCEININNGNVSFNSVSYNSGDLKLNVNLNKEGSSILVNNSVIARKKVHYEIKINHNVKSTNSDVCNNGVTKDDGTICFDVSSYAPKGSKGCLINQDSKIISLNKINGNKINPILLIEEYDAEARHAAFVGNFKDEEQFYLMSRGLSKNEAKNLLISGLLIGILDVCFNEKENLKKKLNDEWR